MPRKERSPVDLRREFVLLAEVEGARIAELCRRFATAAENQ